MKDWTLSYTKLGPISLKDHSSLTLKKMATKLNFFMQNKIEDSSCSYCSPDSITLCWMIRLTTVTFHQCFKRDPNILDAW